ncbi:MAG: purine-nucleoside phosphorylase [Erysipelothrix sp.]|nr:purine-nucleoside phosphorylase [Erysipelothrix sp.]
MATPHIEALDGQIAKVVLMPGDPLRAKYVAETYLEDVTQFNNVRNMFGYTGTYKGHKVSVMGSGMGMPSIGIYSYELYSQYGVEAIIRIGSAGSYDGDLNVYDVILAEDAYSDSSYAFVQNKEERTTLPATKELNDKIKAAAKDISKEIALGTIHSSDVFYRDVEADYWKDIFKETGSRCVEMESFALFHNANVLNKQAACLLTISDSFVTNEKTSAQERQESFNNMMEIALEAAIR